jgi:hypothetical protein
LFQVSPLKSLVETLHSISMQCPANNMVSVLQCATGYLIARPIITMEIARPPTIKSSSMRILRIILRSEVSTCQGLESLPYSWMMAPVSILEIAREALAAIDLHKGE